MAKSYPYTPPTREEYFVQLYGEACTQACAAKILSLSPTTIGSMLHDGRLERVCKTRVSVRSITRYMETAAQIDYETSIRKRRPKLKHFISPSKQKAPPEAATSR